MLYAVAVVLSCVLLAYLGWSGNTKVSQTRNDSGYRTISCNKPEKRVNKTAPAGIDKIYTFSVPSLKPKEHCLAFYVVHQYVTVYFDDERMYQLAPGKRKERIKTTGSNWVMIPVYPEDAGKTVRVVVTPVYDNFKNWHIDFLLGDKLSMFTGQMKKDMPQITLGILAVLAGLVFSCLAVYHIIWKKYDERLAMIGLTAIFVGIWRLTDTRFTAMLFPDQSVILLYISFLAMMLGMIPLIRTVQYHLKTKSGYIFDVLCVFAVLNCMIQILLQLFGIRDLRQGLIVTHITVLLFVIALSSFVVYDCVTGTRETKNRHGLFFLCIVGAAADVIVYYVKGNSSGLSFTLLAFVLYVVLNGIGTLSGYMKQEALLKEKEKELAENRISIMMSQIQPHFLYNSLNTIYHLCGKDPDMAKKAISNFSDYLRGNLNSLKRKTPIPFTEELKHIKIYLSLEKMRFAEGLVINYDISAKDFMLPALSVQPLVENAVKYGAGESKHQTTVMISTKEYKHYFEIKVEDDGVGFDPAVPYTDDKTHIGIENVKNRLWTMCQATLTIDSVPGKGTKAVIRLPREENEDGDYSSG